MKDLGRFPIIETHRGVGIHDFQTPERIESVVKPAIDAVHAMTGANALFQYARSPMHPPEARLLAAAKLEAMFELAAEHRETRPDIDVDLVRAVVAGLESLDWTDPQCFASLCDVPPAGEYQIPSRDEENRQRLKELTEGR